MESDGRNCGISPQLHAACHNFLNNDPHGLIPGNSPFYMVRNRLAAGEALHSSVLLVLPAVKGTPNRAKSVGQPTDLAFLTPSKKRNLLSVYRQINPSSQKNLLVP